MAQDLKLQVLLSAVDRITGPMKKILGGTNATAKALKAAKDQLRELDKAQSQIQGFRKLKNEAASTGTALKASQQQLAKLRTEMAGIENPTRKAAAAYARAERETTKLKNAHLAKLRALRDSRNQLKAAGVETKQLGDHERRLRAEMERTNGVIAKQGRELDQLARRNKQLAQARAQLSRSQAVANNAASAGVAMSSAAVTTAVPVLFAIKSFASFEDAMTGVARQVQGARDNTGKLTPLYYEMGEAIKQMSERLPGTAEDIAAIVEAGARMGIQGKKNLLIYAETTAVMADAFDLPVEQVGNDISKIANLFKVPIDRIGELGDTINWLDDKTLASGGEIIDVMKRIGGTADFVGMSYKDAAALGSTFLSLGSGQEVAGSATNAIITNLANATMQAKRFQGGLQMLGLDARAVQKNMTIDATGTILEVMDAINALPSEKRLEATTRLFGKEFGDDAAKLANNLGNYREQLQLARSAEARGSMSAEAAARAGNLSAIWANTKDSVANLASELGKTLAPALIDIIRSGRQFANTLRTWVKENPGLAGGIMKATAAASALLAVLGGLALSAAAVLSPLAMLRYSAQVLGIKFGPLLTNLRGLAGRALPWLMNGLRALLPLLGGVSAPVLAIAAAIAVAAVLIWKYWQPISAFLRGTMEGAMDVARELGAELGAAFEPLRPVFNWLSVGLGKLWNWLKQLLTPMQATSGQLTTATNAGRAFGYAVMTFMTLPLRALIGVLGLAYRGIAAVFAWDPMATIRTVWGRVTAFFGNLKQTFVTLGFQLMQGMAAGLLSGLNGVRDSINNASEKVVRWFKEKLGIRSPSRVFAQLGDFTMQGLAGGLDRSQSLPIRAIGAVTKNMRAAGAGMALAAATPAVAIDNRAPIAPAGAAAVSGGSTYNITINAAGGAAQDIAQQVRAAIEQLDREKAARQRSRLGDYN